MDVHLSMVSLAWTVVLVGCSSRTDSPLGPVADRGQAPDEAVDLCEVEEMRPGCYRIAAEPHERAIFSACGGRYLFLGDSGARIRGGIEASEPTCSHEMGAFAVAVDDLFFQASLAPWRPADAPDQDLEWVEILDDPRCPLLVEYSDVLCARYVSGGIRNFLLSEPRRPMTLKSYQRTRAWFDIGPTGLDH